MKLDEFLRRVAFLLSKPRRRELEEEMQLHRELRARQLAGQGVVSAGSEALRLFGNETLLKEKADDMWGWNWLEDLARDLKQTGRRVR